MMTSSEIFHLSAIAAHSKRELVARNECTTRRDLERSPFGVEGASRVDRVLRIESDELSRSAESAALVSICCASTAGFADSRSKPMVPATFQFLRDMRCSV